MLNAGICGGPQRLMQHDRRLESHNGTAAAAEEGAASA
jgi:hypothetical protein